MPTPAFGNIEMIGGYPVFNTKDSAGTRVLPTGLYLWNPLSGSNGLWLPANVDANGNQIFSLAGSSANFSEETTASTTDTPYTANVTQWFTFSNDDATNNIQICFDAAVGSAGTMTIKPGEVLNGMPRKFTTLHVKAAADTPAFRAWGV